MPDFIQAILWLSFSALAFLTNIFSAVTIGHYAPFYHGSDVVLFSWSVANAIFVAIVPTVPAVLEIFQLSWNSALCQFYVWSFLTYRTLQVATVAAVTFLWSVILRSSTKTNREGITSTVKGGIVAIWVCASIVGLLPIIGAVSSQFHTGKRCQFMGADLGQGFAVFMIVMVIGGVLFSIISTADAMTLIRYIRKVALVKYGAGRFHVPNKRASIPGSGSYTSHEKYSQLQFSWDVMKFVCAWSVASYIINHLPYAVIELYCLISTNPLVIQRMEGVVTWLILVEMALLPHAQWILCQRYRQAIVYMWRVHIMCHPASEEEDPNSCRLKSYFRAVNQVQTTNSNSGDTRPTSSRPSTSSLSSSLGTHSTRNPSRISLAIIEEEGIRQRPSENDGQNGIIGMVERAPGRDPLRSATIPVAMPRSMSATTTPVTVASLPHSRSSPLRRGYFDASVEPITIEYPKKYGLSSSSSSSRKDWKDQMRKKHLPSIFVNEAFVTADGRDETCESKKDDSELKQIQNALQYYMSGDYHHDNLNTDSLPRGKEDEKESVDGAGEATVDEFALESILDPPGKDIDIDEDTAEQVYRNGSRCSSFKTPVVIEKPPRTFVSKNQCLSVLPDVCSSRIMKKESETGEFSPSLFFATERGDTSTGELEIDNYSENGSDDIDNSDDLEKKDDNADDKTEQEMTSSSLLSTTRDGYGAVSLEGDKLTESLCIVSEIEITNEASCEDVVSSKCCQQPHPIKETVSSNQEEDSFFSSEQLPFDPHFGASPVHPSRDSARFSDAWVYNSSPKKINLGNLSAFNERNDFDVFEFDSQEIVGGTKLISTFHATDVSERYFQTTKQNGSLENDEHSVSIDGYNLLSPTTRSDTSTPLSFTFDPETDRGFEEALSVEYTATPTPEEAEGCNLFLENDMALEENTFKTQAVISRNPSPSCSSVENPFDYLPPLPGFNDTKYNTHSGYTHEKQETSPTSDLTSNTDPENGDSGFNSGLDNSAYTPASRYCSPWPTVPDDNQKTDMQFETDFSVRTGFLQKEKKRSEVYETEIEQDIDPVYF